MTTSSTALQQLAVQAQGISLKYVPKLVLTQAKLCILDTIGCILAGSRAEEALLMLHCEPGSGSISASVLGTAQRRSVQEAIRINAYLGDVLELNDLIGGHASIGNVTTVLALGEATGATGGQMLEAVVRGIEITTRVYESVYPSLRRYTEAGLVPVGIPSTFGTAAAAAHLLQLNVSQTTNALAIAGSLAGWCPAEVIFGNGGSVKPMLFGAQPGDVGVTAAYYAKAGMTGPHQLLDSPVGYFSTASTQGLFNADAWSDRWALMQPRRKLHACCGYLHSPVDALEALHKALGADVLGTAHIQVNVAPYVADVVSKDRLPNSANDSRFHLQYCLALVICGASVILPEHSIAFEEQLQRADIQQAMGRIQVVPDATLDHYHHCRVDVITSAGAKHTKVLTGSRGSPQAPLTDAEVIEKFLLLATPVLGLENTMAVIEHVMSIEDLTNPRDLFDLLKQESS